MVEERVQRRLAAILVADVVGYSRLVEADEAGTVARLKTLQTDLIHPMITEDGGRIVKVMGDGVLVEFGSAVDAVRNGLAIQAEMGQRNLNVAEKDRIAFRVGINVGDVIIDGDDIHGDGVNVAARLEGLCEPGAVYVSASVYDQVMGKLDASFDDLGEQTIKNIARPVIVYWARSETQAATWAAEAPETLPLPTTPSIAILPFKNLGDEPSQDYIADGIRLAIQATLIQIPGLFLIAPAAVGRYRDKEVAARQVAREIGVRYVLEGAAQLRIMHIYPPWFLTLLASAYRETGDLDQSMATARQGLELNPKDIDSRLILCSDYEIAGLAEQAKKAAREIIEIDPTFSLSKYADTQPYKDEAALERLIDGLRKAGLPE